MSFGTTHVDPMAPLSQASNYSCFANPTHTCCLINRHVQYNLGYCLVSHCYFRAHFTIGGVSFSYSKFSTTLVGLLTIAFLIFKLRPHQNRQNVLLPLYYNVLAITSVLYIATSLITATDIEWNKNQQDKVAIYIIYAVVTAVQKFVVVRLRCLSCLLSQES